ncbi:mannonate dehydratase [Ensifer adhaerens]|uniref:Mannonate dehydratase n=1 Tax=Ensifer adhaerens TaxID=106592 RepID=A0ACC5SS87_ENSAD|nr:mannonate dehydratase [Ensifer adhaerens]MBP1871564.1 mannonate dehydratase [Ensifer adhaerens]
MKIGLGLYREQLTPDNYRFALQSGATHIVAHLTNYFAGKDPKIDSGDTGGWGDCSADRLWTYEELSALVQDVRAAGLELAAIENFSPRFWHDILLDGPERGAQIEALKQLIRDAGKAGVPCIGYNFSLAGVYGWTRGPYARGGAESVGFGVEDAPGAVPDPDAPIPDGMVWNMRYRRGLPGAKPVSVSNAEIWDRLSRFLKEVVPVAEEAGVMLGAHPDDPPAEVLRGTARLVNRPEKYDRLMSIVDSPSNGLELCLGSLQEMPGGDIYEHVRRFARSGRIGYIHFRNVRGKMPRYVETFVDEGDIDMAEIVRILRDENYQGVMIPDHTPAMTCAASWHAGKAFALGYMRALVQNAHALGPSRSLVHDIAAE